MSAIKLTSKRQATLPKALCEEMGVRSGDNLRLDAVVMDGQRVWILRPEKSLSMPWYGSLKRYGQAKAHDMKSIRASMARGRQHERE